METFEINESRKAIIYYNFIQLHQGPKSIKIHKNCAGSFPISTLTHTNTTLVSPKWCVCKNSDNDENNGENGSVR